ncbi:aldo/keto reductase [Paenibacillus alginolyticus]|uniref:Aldo/keto reductase n=1 Tax=Paenibacillus alginolyticus TaxID=59839 RepID=A0ABT4GKS5_9BACL|nr:MULTISPECIES: aldo/keto reductase [Paenibacillus]MCY9669080.1 aldo/keto reductase [Paenibacillus alginolyticus]MCY9696760.1 aldo/keto reductase [Paenibacillus alginolyticus]MEC0141846.1 aldo/keto reductase [Paenibacillus alginolyticus]NRF94594.1 aldo/keto reductase [Paenibacillus frigoriresistens]
MKHIQIKGLDKPVSKLIMGSDFFRLDNRQEVSDILGHYLSIGGNTIDTAFIYCGGQSEQALGIWLDEMGNRDDINIFTKGAHHDASGPRVNAEAIRSDLFTSLERLRTDYIDLYALHRDDPATPVGVILEALNEHVEAGRIRAFGGSNWTHERLQEAADYAEQHGLIGFSFSSPNLSLAKANEPFWAGCVSTDERALRWHEAKQFPLLSWSSQARGFFTGRFTPENRDNADLVRVFYSDENWTRLRRAEQLAQEKGVSAIQIALAYVLSQPFPACALIGPRSEAEMLSCRDGAQLVLTPQELAWLDLTAATV